MIRCAFTRLLLRWIFYPVAEQRSWLGAVLLLNHFLYSVMISGIMMNCLQKSWTCYYNLIRMKNYPGEENTGRHLNTWACIQDLIKKKFRSGSPPAAHLLLQ